MLDRFSVFGGYTEVGEKVLKVRLRFEEAGRTSGWLAPAVRLAPA